MSSKSIAVKAVATAAFLGWIAPSNAQTYIVTELGFGDGNGSYGAGVNDSGQVALWWYEDGPDSDGFYFGGGPARAALWQGSVLTDLSTPAGEGNTFAAGINSTGQIAGSSCTGLNAVCHATIWNGTTPTDLGATGGIASSASGISNSGIVVGYTHISGIIDVATVWKGTNATLLGTLPGAGPSSVAFGINNNDQVVGFIDESTGNHAVIWSGTRIIDLGPGVAEAINDLGEAVGGRNLPCCGPAAGGGLSLATLWSGGNTISLGPTNVSSSGAFGINNKGQVVGQTDATGVFYATLWQNGDTIDLNTQLSPALATYLYLENAVSISDNGRILAIASDRITGNSEAVLLTPTSLVSIPTVPTKGCTRSPVPMRAGIGQQDTANDPNCPVTGPLPPR